MEIEGAQNISDLVVIALENWKTDPKQRTYEINHRGKRINLPVINLRTKQVILNHRNHRLSAQLEDLPEGKKLKGNPTSVETQEKLAELLANTEKFKDLKYELENDGQYEPGLITRSGLLVNGNTRAAALLQLSHIDAAKGIDVAVLPNDIVEEDIIELEMFLQMNKRTHQKYTFTNELLFMKRYLDLGKTHKEVAASCGFKARGEARVRTKMRLLDLIDHTREMSNNKSLSYEVFDRKEEHLADLDRKMEKDKKDGNSSSAEEIKNQRILAMLLNLSKDNVRIISDQFISDELFTKRVDGSNSKLYHFLNQFQNNVSENKDDLSGLIDEEPKYKINTGGLLKSFLSNPDIVNEYGDLNNDLSGDFYLLQKEMSELARGLITKKVREGQSQKMHTILRTVTKEIVDVKGNIAEEVNDEQFNKKEFEYALEQARKELNNLFETYANCTLS